MYVCGVTPYAPAHLGHGRSAVAFDIVRRWLTHRGFEVTYVYNITDVEDKIIAASHREGRGWKELAEEHTHEPAAGAGPAERAPADGDAAGQRAHGRDRRAGAATGGDGACLSRWTVTWPSTCQLRRVREALPPRLRLSRSWRGAGGGRRAKRDPRDFFVWKAAKPGEPSWESPWGPGRPGWHIECSAMSREVPGRDGFDIHGGGQDLIFPHHENEIAQSEAACGARSPATGCTTAWWACCRRGGEAEKMSKSLGNVIGLREALDQVGGPALRYYFSAAHYGSDLPFSRTALEAAQHAFERLCRSRPDRGQAAGAGAKEGARTWKNWSAARRRRRTTSKRRWTTTSTPPGPGGAAQPGGRPEPGGGERQRDLRRPARARRRWRSAGESLEELAGVLGLDLRQEDRRPRGLSGRPDRTAASRCRASAARVTVFHRRMGSGPGWPTWASSWRTERGRHLLAENGK